MILRPLLALQLLASSSSSGLPWSSRPPWDAVTQADAREVPYPEFSSLVSCSVKASHLGLSTFESVFSPPSVSAESHGLLQALDKKWPQG